MDQTRHKQLTKGFMPSHTEESDSSLSVGVTVSGYRSKRKYFTMLGGLKLARARAATHQPDGETHLNRLVA